MDYGQLNYISFASVSIAFAISIFLPKVSDSIYFHRETSRLGEASSSSSSGALKNAAKFLWMDAKTAYTDSYVLKWYAKFFSSSQRVI